MEHVFSLVHKISVFVEQNGFAAAEKLLLEGLSLFMILSAFIVAIILFVIKFRISYGRYAEESILAKYSVGARLGWFLQEVPSLIVPAIALLRPNQSKDPLAFYCVLFFTIHYFQRSIIYPFLIRGGKNTIPIHYFLMGVVFTTWNGYMQGHYHALYAEFDRSALPTLIRSIGVVVFIAGMFINIQSDHILRNLRSDAHDKSYKIPRGGMFEYVSGANFFGEIVEWFGYLLFCQSLPSLAFALFTFANTAPRAIEHHNWYLKKFDDYPKDRKAVIPFFL